MRARGLSNPRVIVFYRLGRLCPIRVCALVLILQVTLPKIFCARVAWGSKANWTRFVTFQLTLNHFISFSDVPTHFESFVVSF